MRLPGNSVIANGQLGEHYLIEGQWFFPICFTRAQSEIALKWGEFA